MAKANMTLTKNPMPTQDPILRGKNFSEVALGYTDEVAIDEALRCLECKNMPCVSGCPVNVHIPEFISGYCKKLGSPRGLRTSLSPGDTV